MIVAEKYFSSFGLSQYHGSVVPLTMFLFFALYAAQNTWKMGRVASKKQPLVVKIPPHTVHKLYCETTVQRMLGKHVRNDTCNLILKFEGEPKKNQTFEDDFPSQIFISGN